MLPETKELIQGVQNVHGSPNSAICFLCFINSFFILHFWHSELRTGSFPATCRGDPGQGDPGSDKDEQTLVPFTTDCRWAQPGCRSNSDSLSMFLSPDCGCFLHWSLCPAGLPHCCLPWRSLLGSNQPHPGAHLRQTAEVLLSTIHETPHSMLSMSRTALFRASFS